MTTCPWCGNNAEEAAARHEGPHATWCVHYRHDQRGGIKKEPPPEGDGPSIATAESGH